MKASFVDLRTKSSEILQALERNEEVTVLYRGQPKAIIQPINPERNKPSIKAEEHAAFGIWADRDDWADVAEQVRTLRKGRYRDL